MSASKTYYDALLAITPAITDDDGYSHPDLAYRYGAIDALSRVAAARATKLVHDGWAGSFKELLAHVRAGSGPAAAWLADHPRAGDELPTRAPAAVSTCETWHWRRNCTAIGPAAFDYNTVIRALASGYDLGPLGAHPLSLPYGGVNGARHFHPGCGPTDARHRALANPNITHTTLATLHADLPHASQWHRCAQDLNAWLPPELVGELSMLADAATLTADWRAAQDKSAARGRPIFPGSTEPLTSGLLTELADAATTYFDAHLDRTHIGALATTLATTAAHWGELNERHQEVQDDDPHQSVLAWAATLGLPALAGTMRQIRWAETIRHDLCAGGDGQSGQVAARETAAAAWIGLHHEHPADLFTAWLDMRDRAMRRARNDLEMERARNRGW